MSDFMIAGAGINGLLLARELAQAGASVTLIDKGAVGQEASWAGGGIVSPLYPWRYPFAVTALANWAQAFYPELAAQLTEQTGIDVEFNQCGLLMLDAEDSGAALQWAQQENRQMLQLNADDCYQKELGLRDGFRQGLWMPMVANIRNPRLCKALKASLLAMPQVRLIENAAVHGLESAGDKVIGIILKNAAGGTKCLAVEQLIITAGAWSSEILAKVGLNLPVAPVKGQMLLYKFSQPPINSILLHNGRYLIPRTDGHLLVGSTLEHAGFDKTITQEAESTLRQSAEKILPVLETMKPVAQWAGLRPGSADGVPIIDKVPGFVNLHVSAGHYRNGLVLAPASARLMADLLLRREPEINPRAYRFPANSEEQKLAG